MNKTVMGDVKCQSCFAALDMRSGGGIVRCEFCGTDNVLNRETRIVKAQDSHQFTLALYNAIAREFDNEGIRDLCVRVSDRLEYKHVYRIDFDDLRGESRKMKALSLVEWCRMRGELQPLVDVVIAIRPQIDFV